VQEGILLEKTLQRVLFLVFANLAVAPHLNPTFAIDLPVAPRRG
jgi:hypothetical protein